MFAWLTKVLDRSILSSVDNTSDLSQSSDQNHNSNESPIFVPNDKLTLNQSSDQEELHLFTNDNPYIHGTNSNVLDLLTYTDFSLMEPIDMIDKYAVAPVTGEITGGGFDSVWSKCEPCFG